MRVSATLLALLAAVVCASGEDFFAGQPVEMLDDSNWDTYVAEHPMFLSMFFAPWCGHCKQMKPAYGEAAAMFADTVPLVAVDCTVAKTSCGKYDVKGFPTLKFFNDGKAEAYPAGRDKASIVSFLEKKAESAPQPALVVDKIPKMKVKALKKAIAARGLACVGCSDKKMLVSFLTKHADMPVLSALKAELAVKAYTNKLQGKKTKAKSVKKSSGRTFVAERRWKAALKVQEEGWKDEDGTTINGDVHHLITDDFVAQTEKTEKMVVMFYAPWCAHCTTFKPIFANASTTLKETLPDVGFASVDCETNPDLCRKYLADSYPTVKYFDFSDKKDKGKLFSRGQRGEKQLLMWVDVMHKGGEWSDTNDIAADKWEDVDDDAVHHLIDSQWAAFRKEHPVFLTMFYAPWCGHCKTMKPGFAEAAADTKDLNIPLVAMDCTVNEKTCKLYDVTGYPTMKAFESSDGDAVEYSGGRDTLSLAKWVRKQAGEPEPPTPDNDVEPEDWGDDNGAVVHLNDAQWDGYLQKNPHALVMFYAPWCGHCKKLKPAWAEASTALADSAGVIAAIDCTQNRKTCERYDVTGYPTLKWFGDGVDAPAEYGGSRDAKGIATWVGNKAPATEAAHDEL